MEHIIQGLKFKKGTKFMNADDTSVYTFHDVQDDRMIISNDFEDKIYASFRISLLDYHNDQLRLVY